MPAGAIIGGTVISAGASLLSSRSQSRAAENAAEAQVQAADRSAEVAQNIYNDQTARQEPFRQLGMSAINPMADLMGLDYQYGAQPAQPINQGNPMAAMGQIGQPGMMPQQRYSGLAGMVMNTPEVREYVERQRMVNGPTTADVYEQPNPMAAMGAMPQQPPGGRPSALEALQSRPGYQFRLQQGNDAYEASAAARGLGNSGAQLRALAEYNQNYASNEYDKEFNRLNALMGGGQVATNNMNAAAGQYGQNAMSAFTNAGNARASGYMNQGAASANAINGISGAIGGGLGMYGGYQGWWG